MTLGFIVLSSLVSLLAFSRPLWMDKLKFNAYLIHKDRQWYRFLTYGLVHADWIHLLVNMMVLYSFGDIVETIFLEFFGLKGMAFYAMLYVGGLGFSTLFDFGKYKDQYSYNAVGASGAVSAVVFSSIILYPQGRIFLFFIPVGIPAPLFGILYLLYSAYMARKGHDNIGHSAHFWGAIFGVIFTVAIDSRFLENFILNIFQ